MDNFRIYELTSVYENNTPYFLRNLITDYQNELDSYQETISNRKQEEKQQGKVISVSGQHSPFAYTYNESFSITQNAQKTLSFSMNKYISRANEWHENPFTNKVQVGSLLLLQDRFNNEYFFTVKEIKYDIKENNIIFNYTCQDSFSYQNSRQNMGYTLENDASSKDFIGALTLDDWVINYIQPECGITYTYLKLNEGLYQGTDGNIYSFKAGNELKDVDHIIKEAYQPALYDENGKIKDKRDNDYFETIPFSCSNSNASAALISLADQIDFQLITFEREKSLGSNEFHQFFWFEPKKNDCRIGLTYDPNTSIKSFGLSHKGESLTTILNVSGPTYNDEIITLLPELPPFFFRYFNSKEWETTTYYPGLFSRLCQNKTLEYKNNSDGEFYFKVCDFDDTVTDFNTNKSFFKENNLYIQCYNKNDTEGIDEIRYFNIPRMYDRVESYYFDTEENQNKYSYIAVKDSLFNSQLTDFTYVLFDIDSDNAENASISFSSRDQMPSLKDGHRYKLFVQININTQIASFSADNIDSLILNFNRSASQEEIDFATIADNCPWLENKLIDFSYFYENGLLSENEYKTIRKILMNDLRIINGKLMIYTQSYYNALSEKTKKLAKLNESLDAIGVTCQADILEPLKEGKKINFNDLSSLRTLYNGFFTEPESKTGLLNYGSVLSEYFNNYISAEQRFLKNIYSFREIFEARNTYQNESLYKYNFSIVDDSHVNDNEQRFYCFNENNLFTKIDSENFDDKVQWNSDTGECWTPIYQTDDSGKTFSPTIIADLNKFNNNELYVLDLEAFENLNDSEPYNNNVYYQVDNEIKDKKYFKKDYSIKVGRYHEDYYSLFPSASDFNDIYDTIDTYVRNDKKEDLFLDIYGYTPGEPSRDYLFNIPLSELYVANQGDYQVVFNGKEYEFLRKNKEGKTQKDYVRYLEWVSNPDDSIRKEVLNPYDYKTYISIPFVNCNNQHSFYHWYNPTWGIVWDTKRINELKEITSTSDRLKKAAAWYEFTTEGIPYIDIFARDWNLGATAVVFASGSNSISNYLNWKKQHNDYSQDPSIETTEAIIKRNNNGYDKDPVFDSENEFPNSTTEAYALFWKLFGTMHNVAEHNQNLYFKDIRLNPLDGLDAEVDDSHQYRILVLKDPFNPSADWNNLSDISAIAYYYIYKKLIGLDLSESLKDKHITTVREIFSNNVQANGKIYSIDDTKFLIFKLIDYKQVEIDETNYDPTRVVYDASGRKIDFNTAPIVSQTTYDGKQVSKTNKEKVYQLATVWNSTETYFVKLNEDTYSRAYTCQNIIDNEDANTYFYVAGATELTQYFFEPNKKSITLPLYRITYKKDENNLLSTRTAELMSIDNIQFNYNEDPASALVTIGDEDTIQLNLDITLEEEISGLNNGTFWFKYHNRLDFPMLFEHAAAIEAQLNQYWIQAYGASKYCKFFLPEHWTPEADQTPNCFTNLVIVPEIEDDEVKSVYLSSKYLPQVELIREGSKTRFTKYYFEYQNDDWDKNSIVLNNLTYSDTAATQYQKLQSEISNNEALGQIFEYLQEDIKNWEVKENGVTSYYLYQSGGTTWAKFLEEIVGSKEFDNFGGIYDLGFKRLRLAYQGKDFREYERYKELHKNKWNLLRSVYGYLLLENDYKNTTATSSIDLLKMAKYAFKDYMNPERAYSISIIDAAKLGGYKNQEIRVGDAIKIDASSYYNEYDQIYKSLSQLLFITDIKYTLRNPTDISVTVNNIKYSDKLIQRLAKLIK